MTDRRHRLLDGLVGAAILLLVLVAIAVVGLWTVSRPQDAAGPSPGATGRTGGTSETGESPSPAPSDLAAGETWLGDVDLSSSELVSPDGRLRLDATVPFSDVAALLAEDATVSAGEEGLTEMRRTVTVLGRTVDVRATGTVRAQDGLIVVEPQEIDLGGPTFLAPLAGAAVRELVTIRRPVDGVPPGLELDEVTVQEDGFRARFTGQDVRLGE